MDNILEKSLINLYELSIEKLALIEQILELTRSQTFCVETDDIDKLGKIINDKQFIIDKINTIDSAFNEIFYGLKEKFGVASIGDLEGYDAHNVKKLQTAIAEIMNLLKEIVAVEKVNNEKVKVLRDNMAGNIKKVNQSKLVNSAYRPVKGTQSSHFYDKKG